MWKYSLFDNVISHIASSFSTFDILLKVFFAVTIIAIVYKTKISLANVAATSFGPHGAKNTRFKPEKQNIFNTRFYQNGLWEIPLFETNVKIKKTGR